MNTPMKILSVFVFLVSSTFAFGGLEGVYQIDVEALRAAIKATPDYAASPKPQQEFMVGVADQMKLTLTLKADASFEAIADMMGHRSEAGGTYAVEEAELVLTTILENGSPKAEPEVARLKIAEGNLLIEEPGMPFPFLLRKGE